MKIETRLARAFATVATCEQQMDTLAGGILAIVVEAKVRDLEAFDPLVRAAYAANGWNASPGRPSASSEAADVPGTVRTYVTTVRRAFRLGIPVAGAKSFSNLRNLIRKHLEKKRPKRRTSMRGVPEKVKLNFVGVELASANDVNGALIHDVGAVYAHLPAGQRNLFERQLRQLVERYLPHAKGIQSPAAEEPLKKAA